VRELTLYLDRNIWNSRSRQYRRTSPIGK